MSLRKDIEKIIFSFEEREGRTASYLILDSQTYFLLKEIEFGSTDLAVEMEIEDYLGLKVCFNNFGREYIDVA